MSQDTTCNCPPRIDLAWAAQKIPGFAEMVATQARVRASELEYKQKHGVSNGRQEDAR